MLHLNSYPLKMTNPADSPRQLAPQEEIIRLILDGTTVMRSKHLQRCGTVDAVRAELLRLADYKPTEPKGKISKDSISRSILPEVEQHPLYQKFMADYYALPSRMFSKDNVRLNWELDIAPFISLPHLNECIKLMDPEVYGTYKGLLFIGDDRESDIKRDKLELKRLMSVEEASVLLGENPKNGFTSNMQLRDGMTWGWKKEDPRSFKKYRSTYSSSWQSFEGNSEGIFMTRELEGDSKNFSKHGYYVVRIPLFEKNDK